MGRSFSDKCSPPLMGWRKRSKARGAHANHCFPSLCVNRSIALRHRSSLRGPRIGSPFRLSAFHEPGHIVRRSGLGRRNRKNVSAPLVLGGTRSTRTESSDACPVCARFGQFEERFPLHDNALRIPVGLDRLFSHQSTLQNIFLAFFRPRAKRESAAEFNRGPRTKPTRRRLRLPSSVS